MEASSPRAAERPPAGAAGAGAAEPLLRSIAIKERTDAAAVDAAGADASKLRAKEPSDALSIVFNASWVKLGALVGEGAFSRVYEGVYTDPRTSEARPVAVKILKKSMLKRKSDCLRFIKEAKVMTRLSHRCAARWGWGPEVAGGGGGGAACLGPGCQAGGRAGRAGGELGGSTAPELRGREYQQQRGRRRGRRWHGPSPARRARMAAPPAHSWHGAAGPPAPVHQ
jgi:hypothetical protein